MSQHDPKNRFRTPGWLLRLSPMALRDPGKDEQISGYRRGNPKTPDPGACLYVDICIYIYLYNPFIRFNLHLYQIQT
jgi:hypothetical protein